MAEAGISDSGLLSVMGAINWDISIFEERFARQGEEVPVLRVEEYSGGKGANVAVAAARILGRSRVALVGALGRDELYYRQVKELRSEGVIVDGILRPRGSKSGTAYILIDGVGKKTIHTHFGANDLVRPEHLRQWKVARILGQSRILIVMDPLTDVAESAAKIAKTRGADVIYSPGVRSQEGLKTLEGVLEEADYLVLDKVELKNLAHSADVPAMSRDFLSAYPRLKLVVTLGDGGCMLATDSGVKRMEGVDLALLGRKPVNTTGCGDAFLGVLSGYMMLGMPMAEAIAWANLAGALKATRYETRGSPIREELEKSMARLQKIRRSQIGLPPSAS